MEFLSPRQKEVFYALQNFIEEHGYPPTFRELAKKLGIVNPTAIQRMLNIFKEKGLVDIESGKSRTIKLKHKTSPFEEEIISLPIAGRIVAGGFEEAIENPEEKIAVPAFLARNNSKAFLLKVKGDSMEPEFHEGDFVVILPETNAYPGDIVAVMLEGEATLKQLLEKNGKRFLHPFNSAYPDISVTENFQLLGKACGLLRML
jgi:repressor LexA